MGQCEKCSVCSVCKGTKHVTSQSEYAELETLYLDVKVATSKFDKAYAEMLVFQTNIMKLAADAHKLADRAKILADHLKP